MFLHRVGPGDLMSRQSTIEELKAAGIDPWQALELARADYNSAVETVAAMHKAALGKKRDPIRGVVEDIEDLRIERDRAALLLSKAGAFLHQLEEQAPEVKTMTLEQLAKSTHNIAWTGALAKPYLEFRRVVTAQAKKIQLRES
jgi:hypothetical protein